MLTFSGFNGFGQFGENVGQRALEMKEFTLPEWDNDDDGKFLIAPGWSYVAYARGRQLLLRGFLNNAPNTYLKVQMNATITQLASCDRFCLVLLENGKVFKLLARKDAEPQEVKLDSDTGLIKPQKRTIFGILKEEEPLKITHIACGENMSVAISNKNGVYSLPSKIYEFPKHVRIKQLSCGCEHALLLTNNGDVYSWGNGLRGQLGQDILGVEEAPILIEALAGIKIQFIAAGGWHSVAISAFGDLYTWGLNVDGQLGLKLYKNDPAGNIQQPRVFPLPQIVEQLECTECIDKNRDADDFANEECSPLKVFCGARHTIVQMSCGALYATGCNAHGQLALNKETDLCDTLEKVPLDIKKFKSLVCGAWCTIIST